MKHRRGASLIELMVVISILTVVLGLVGTLFHRLFRAEQLSSRATVTEITTMRLADQFRRDIHAAQSVKRSEANGEAGPTLELAGAEDSTTIVYMAGHNKVQRNVMREHKIVAHETYRLPSCLVSFPVTEVSEPGIDDSGNHAVFVRLSLERPHATVTASTNVRPPLRGLIIDAELGRDRRLTAALSLPRSAKEESP